MFSKSLKPVSIQNTYGARFSTEDLACAFSAQHLQSWPDSERGNNPLSPLWSLETAFFKEDTAVIFTLFPLSRQREAYREASGEQRLTFSILTLSCMLSPSQEFGEKPAHEHECCGVAARSIHGGGNFPPGWKAAGSPRRLPASSRQGRLRAGRGRGAGEAEI